jgi:predicted metal-binding membrane protein
MTGKTTSPKAGPVERLVRQDRLIVLACAAIVVSAAAAYTVFGVGMAMTALDMTRMAGPIGQPMRMGIAVQWTPAYAALIFLMWWIMMVAMMIPSAAPVLLLFTAVKRMGSDHASATLLSGLFLVGYLLAWAGFSVVAATLQWGLEAAGISDGPMMAIRSRGFAGLVLIAAGLYQFSTLKKACLKHCRSPAHYLAEHNRSGSGGALRMGLEHGAYCLGCCWALMALLFVGGVMNLYWIAGISLYVAAEKLLPGARWLESALGAVLIGAGIYMVFGSAVLVG